MILEHMIAFKKFQLVKGDNYTTGCLLGYNCFKEYSKMIAIDLSKQQTLDADPKAIKQINFTRNLERDRNKRKIFIIEDVKETILYYSQGTVSIVNLFCFNKISILNDSM